MDLRLDPTSGPSPDANDYEQGQQREEVDSTGRVTWVGRA